jgi:hypothetical protein
VCVLRVLTKLLMTKGVPPPATGTEWNGGGMEWKSAVYIYLRSSYGGRSAYGRVLRILRQGRLVRPFFFDLNPDVREIVLSSQ